MELRIESFGDVQLSRRLLRFGENVGDLSPAFEQIVDDFAKLGFRQFQSEGKVASGGWAPLAASTIAAKGHDTILSASGDLETSLTGTADGGLRTVKITRDELVFKSNVPYAEFHQRGTRNMKQRRPFELRKQDRSKVVKRIQDHLVKDLDRG